MNGLYDAKLDGAPVLAITGQTYHDKYLASVGKCHRFKLVDPYTLAGNSILNHDFLVSVTGSPNSTRSKA